MILLAILVIIALFFIYLIKLYQKYEINRKKLSHIPGHNQIIGIGPLQRAIHIISEKIGKLLAPIDHLSPFKSDKFYNGNQIYKVASTGWTVAYVRDAEMAKKATTHKDFDRAIKYFKASNFIGVNVFGAEDHEWKKHRRVCNPAFGSKNIELVAATTNDSFDHIKRIWDKKLEKTDRWFVGDHLLKMALSVIGSAGFGKDMSEMWEEEYQNTIKGKKSDDSDDDELFEKDERLPFTKSLLHAAHYLFLYVGFPHIITKNVPIKVFKRAHKSVEDFLAYIDDIIDEGDKRWKERKQQQNNSEQKNSKQRKDILSLLLKANKEDKVLGKKELRSNSMIFILAGHETTANTLTFALAYLASHPQIQQRMLEEVNRVVGDEKEITIEHTKQLKLCTNVFKETIRLMPLLSFLQKESLRDTTLGNYFIPKGTTVNVDLFNLHRNPKYWKSPNQFNPDRFETDQIVPFSYLPFSAGRKRCMGMKFAEVETIVFLARLVREYKLKLPKGVSEPNPSNVTFILTTIPEKPFDIIFTKRN